MSSSHFIEVVDSFRQDPYLYHKITVSILFVLLTTRIWTGLTSQTKAYADGTLEPPSRPYWIPLIGPIIPFLFGFDRHLKSVRDTSNHGLFSFAIGSARHVMIFTPSLTKKLFNLRKPYTDDHFLIWPFFHRVLGGENSLKSKWEPKWDVAMKPIIDGLTREPYLSQMVDVVVRRTQEHVPNIVSFMDSPIDQSLWERASDATLIQGAFEAPAMELDLLPFLRHLSGITFGPALTGQAFQDNNPYSMQDMFEFDAGIFYLLVGIPWWFPIPTLSKAIRARRRLQLGLAEMHKAMDATADGKPVPSEWQDIDDIGYTFKERHRHLRDAFTPMQRARADLSVFWAMHANTNNLIFWLIFRIYSIPGLKEKIREETKPHCRVKRAESVLGRQSAPRLDIDAKGLRLCTLLRSCFFEALRIHSAAWSVHKVARDVVLPEDASDVQGNTTSPGSFLIKAGTVVDVQHACQHLDPRFWENPEDFIPDRFIAKHPETGDAFVRSSNVRAFGGGGTICKGRMLAEQEALILTASIVALWDIQPAEVDWKLPGHRWATGVLLPDHPTRVKITRREI